MTKWICNAPWNSVVFYSDGTIAPCSQYKDKFPITNISTDTFKNIQDNMLNGIKPLGCSACINDEGNGLISYREDVYGDDELFRNSIKYIDIRNSNNCNLKCRICGPEYSNSWNNIINETSTVQYTSILKYVLPLLTTDVNDIYFTGGEPFLNADHPDILKELDKRNLLPNIRLRYNTNLTTLSLKNKDILYFWNKAKTVLVNASIEAIGTPLENIRSGCKWSKIEKNINTIKDIPHIDLTLTSTVSSLNVWFIPELFQYCENNNITLQLQELYDPDFLTINSLPLPLREKASELLQKYSSNTSIKSIISNINTYPEHLFSHLVAHILYLDKINDENLFDLLPYKRYTIDHILSY